MQNASPPKSCSYGKQKNKEIALANNLFLAFPAGIEPTVYRLGVIPSFKSPIKSVKYRVFC